MKGLAITACMLMLTLPATADVLVFEDDFEDGIFDGWHHFSVVDAGYEFWLEDGELWGRSSSLPDCGHCPGCDGIALVDDLIVEDVALEVKITNHNSCGLICLLLRVTEPYYESADDADRWVVIFDPGTSQFELAAQHGASWIPGCQLIDSFSFGIGVPHYFRVVLIGQTMELWHRLSPTDSFELVADLSCPEGCTAGYIGVRVCSSGKRVSYDDFSVYELGASPTEPQSWTTIKALYSAGASVEGLPN
jgi:hypothetical protein